VYHAQTKQTLPTALRDNFNMFYGLIAKKHSIRGATIIAGAYLGRIFYERYGRTQGIPETKIYCLCFSKGYPFHQLSLTFLRKVLFVVHEAEDLKQILSSSDFEKSSQEIAFGTGKLILGDSLILHSGEHGRYGAFSRKLNFWESFLFNRYLRLLFS
jgi:hypothetical protein